MNPEERQHKIKMSCHARDAWRNRVSSPVPSEAEIEKMLAESVVIQQQRELYTTRGYPVRVLALYWHPAQGIVMKVDHRTSKVVTVLTQKALEEKYHEDRKCKALHGL